jgi:hypothetical protein
VLNRDQFIVARQAAVGSKRFEMDDDALGARKGMVNGEGAKHEDL